MSEQPVKVIGFNDGRMTPKNETLAYRTVKKLFIFFVVVSLIGSVVFKESFIAEGGISVWICIFITTGYLIKKGGHERKECYSELHFYKEYMVFYVPKHHIGYKNDKMEIQKMYYKDVTKSTFRTNTRKYVIMGKVEETHFKYINDIVSREPCYHKIYDGMIYFYTVFDFEHNFKEIIEKYTPLVIKEDF